MPTKHFSFSNPDDRDLTVLYTWDAYTASWEFYEVMIVRDETDNKVYLATDSGCSCPVPFEDHVFPSDFLEIRSWHDAKAEIDRVYPRDGYYKRNPLDGIRSAVKRAVNPA